MMVQRHILIVTFPAQGHINPALQFANRLIRVGVHVTFFITTYTRRRMTTIPTAEGFTLVDFSDGYDDDGYKGNDIDYWMSNLRSHGSKALTELITDSTNEGRRPVDCLVCTLLLPWATLAARELNVPSALLWIQPATVFDLYYYYFNGYGDIIRSKAKEDPSCPIVFPNLPITFTSRDLPSFLIPTNAYTFALPSIREELELLAEEPNPKVLVNTFDLLEPEGLSAIDSVKLVGIGPLIQSDSSFAAHLCQPSDDKSIMEWLSSKPESSVVYVSFGSLSVLTKRQMEEMERGLLESGRSFLWVIRAPPRNGEEKEEDYNYKLMSSKVEVNGNMIVPWCAQVEVLSHPSVGCFVTHCGWNSTLESLVCGVPMVTFPQWTDQGTNAMLVEEVWKTGVRVRASDQEDGFGLVDGDEIKRCLEIVMGDGERGEEIRKNAMKWKGLARDAVEEGGSSDKNLRAFVDGIA